MTDQSIEHSHSEQERWLKHYYFWRTAVSAIWVVAAFAIGQHSTKAATVLLIAYPAWDALANYFDAQQSGGLRKNPTQAINVMVSLLTTVAVVVAFQFSMNWVIGVYGAWAILSGLLQLATAVRRWRSYGAQWAMILSGAQSALAGGFFCVQATMPSSPSIVNIAGYAAVGAFYFLVSAVWLTVAGIRRKPMAGQV